LREFSTVQEKILDRALYLIGKRGNYDVPIREITRAAGVNVSAVSYYFGSKAKMLQEVDYFFIRNYEAAYAALEGPGEPEERLTRWANEVMEYTLQYPGIQLLQRYVLGLSEENAMKAFLVENARRYDRKVEQVMRDAFCAGGVAPAMLKVMLYSALIHPASFGTDSDFDTASIRDPDLRMGYIRFVMETLKKGVQS
jgi:AcrR family transcriptional regulator